MIRISKAPRIHLASRISYRSISSNSSLPSESDGQIEKPASRRIHYGPRLCVVSGIQPTGIPHLGNYLGALRKWKELQDEKIKSKNPGNYSLYFMVVDLHALTVAQNRAQLLQQRRESFASLLAIGLDPNVSILFMQSQMQEHTELMWILSTVASTGYLSRMTQWKSKLGLPEEASMDEAAAREKLRLGLFSYPVLQAADILLYRPTHVPVGADQEQHVELARSLARSFNAQYGSPEPNQPIFRSPKLMLSPAKRVMSLKDPTSKMSKSDPDEKSRILITDSEDQIKAKIRVALTDSINGISYDPATRPGVSNLIEILKHVTRSEATCEDIATDNANLSMKAFKEHVADNIINELRGIGDKFHEIMKPTNQSLDDAMAEGRMRASAKAGNTMRLVRAAVGLTELPSIHKNKQTLKSQENKDKIMKEQEVEEVQDIDEPSVLPQKKDGVDLPIAS